MPSIDYRYVPGGQQLTTSGYGGGGGGFGGDDGFNPRAFEEMLRRRAERGERLENEDRRVGLALQLADRRDATAAQHRAESAQRPFQRLALSGAQRADRMGSAEEQAMRQPPPMRAISLGGGPAGYVMDPTRMNAYQRQAYLPQGSGFTPYTPTGQEIQGAVEDDRRWQEEGEEEDEARRRQAETTPPEKRNPFLSRMLFAGGGGR